MDRRNLFQIVGATAAAGPVEAMQRALPYVPKFFNGDEAFLVERLADIIIPKDAKSGGAADAGVIKYIDLVVHYGEAGQQQAWRNAIAAVETDAKKRFGNGFRRISREQQEEILAAMARDEDQRTDVLGRFFVNLKRLTVEAYHCSSLHWKQNLGRGLSVARSEFPGCEHKSHA
ncbi:MAG: gluconate 2-dehydrogenase subunit 3 family protein [Acidobacteria bacterium]|nr:gluconate 2-dehydrogenase subunit 3 family protein [Acidobacteriota bacterium]